MTTSPPKDMRVESAIYLALDALEFDAGDWKPESIDRHLREQIELAKGHLRAAVEGESSPDFKGFADQMFAICWAGASADGGTIQELGVQHGLLEETTMPEPCGKDCMCRDCEADFPATCYRKTYNKEASS